MDNLTQANVKKPEPYLNPQAIPSLGRSNTLPWLCVGDYNEIVKHSEKLGSALRPARQMDRFCTVIHHCCSTQAILGLILPGLEIIIRMAALILGQTEHQLLLLGVLSSRALLFIISQCPFQITPYSLFTSFPPPPNHVLLAGYSVLRPCGCVTFAVLRSSKKHGKMASSNLTVHKS